jgi:hypothetical protein
MLIGGAEDFKKHSPPLSMPLMWGIIAEFCVFPKKGSITRYGHI